MLNRYEARFNESSKPELDLQNALDEAVNPLRLLEEFCFEIERRDPPYDPKEFYKLVIGTLSPFLSDFDYILSLSKPKETPSRDVGLMDRVREALAKNLPKTSLKTKKAIVREIMRGTIYEGVAGEEG